MDGFAACHEDPQCHVVLADFGSACKITEQTRLADQAELSESSCEIWTDDWVRR